MATIKKAQGGGLIKKAIKAATTAKKSTISKRAAKLGEDYDNLLSDESLDWANSPAMKHHLDNKKPAPNLRKAQEKVNERKAAQSKQVDDSYNTSGPAIKVKRKTGGIVKKKMKNGGSLSGLKASTKRVGPVDPKGAFTKVQKKTLAGAKGKATLTKDKQLGATKMAKTGAKMSKGKSC
jgi:hypothetical protein